MTNLDDFLNKNIKPNPISIEIVDGSFSCQDPTCQTISNEAIMDKATGEVEWLCVCGHRSRIKL